MRTKAMHLSYSLLLLTLCVLRVCGLVALLLPRRIEGLEGLRSLTELNLSYNLISRMEGLSTLTALTSLNLMENNIHRVCPRVAFFASPSLWPHVHLVSPNVCVSPHRSWKASKR